MNRKLLACLTGLLTPSMVFAHEAVNSGGFLSGLSHPILGFDHLLAMISVGVLSAQIGGRSVWTVPAVFVCVMLFGGVLGINNVSLFSVELAIAFSVMILGIAIFADKKLQPMSAMLLVGFFAIFHGHAHGTEMPTLSKPILYAFGFIVGTTLIHIAGVLIGLLSKKVDYGTQLLRYSGAVIAGIGFYLVIG